MRRIDTNRWVGIDGAALVAGAAGVLFQRPALLLVAALGVVYTAYAWFGDAPEPQLAVERRVGNADPDPEAEVDVTVEVRNVGSRTLTDLRLVDGVPPALAVTDGSPRHGTALRPGAGTTFSYTVEAVRGAHEWEPLTAITRSPSGSREQSVDVEAAEPTSLSCTPTLEAIETLPLRGLTTPYAGRVSTDVTGSGLEFSSTREYRRGDPLSRIDWNRYARTGELSTVEFRQERAAAVVLLVDARETAYVAPDREHRNAVERSVDAAAQAFASLLDAGDRVGIAALSPRECWLAPGAGRDHRNRGRELLASHPALAPTPPEQSYLSSSAIRRLRRRLPADAQVLFFSPLIDERAVEVARGLDARGHPVTVVSPDATATDTVGRRLARLERRNRLTRLRRAGLRVVDWGAEPLGARVARAERRWSG
ncbi:Uncharacterized conserved protein, DUF58 family, contains vWF domain [Halobellus clavatus]|uniref:Uncharacterized conserved protein, DUF58 family, contains vWF domain n=2 Tax=Halobellus clavatus TaxID=660517 RepID=A0A1H3CZQ6_9EURY|nr:Uncharacterized conserved protein, DUF58 family, contains vWF domain [Halobellus clavatus]